ncbi:hypothetical protein BDP27DRAFT_1391109 [Rhodocollybia butyracea]|uniref:WDR59/RTC1-like RING zinc finger domain-containing protein n=1 Tax=Rhodocollybia butyracea TaxID=206335 RepID=A0A9P5Q1K9_9AGAR|nr:hypothetical protein BDP27DRAFT_1391109 [Rhodocollybia butyracea]
MESHVNSTTRRPSLLSTKKPSSASQDSDDAEDDGTNFRMSLQIDMKGLVGDAVGNMSISPFSRDVVLAARRGLFIIDLESPFDVPRFLPQGGTWDVADVQWNPHPSRAEYIVSTSSEKLLIWNLYMTGKTSIEHILHSHYRAITDINWHTTERDTVVSTGIDSWVWAWDMRETRKPIFGLCAFSSPGTQVKWNRQNPDILASSHSDKVLIWDRRKGSLPLTTIHAHTSRIYGIDWSQNQPTELVTCSLDKTIKVWDSKTNTLSTTIKTAYPVWRARSLPFGRGVLSLAQRGETALEMFALESSPEDPSTIEYPVDSFQGHSDVVKEFVWRKGANNTAFQLITWSKDRTLRFWPMDSDMMQKVGSYPHKNRKSNTQQESQPIPADTPIMSFRDPLTFPDTDPNPESTMNPNQNPISAPIGHRSILAEVRAGGPLAPSHQIRNRQRTNSYNVMISTVPSPPQYDTFGSASTNATATLAPATFVSAPGPGIGNPDSLGLPGSAVPIAGGTMSRGAAGGLKSRARVDALSWLSSVKDASSAGVSASAGSNTAATSGLGDDGSGSNVETRSVSEEGSNDREKGENLKDSQVQTIAPGPSLQDEITSVLSSLPSSKVRLEKHDLALTSSKKQHRTLTLGLQVPWARSESGSRHASTGFGTGSGATYSYSTQSVFLRVTFTFPREYPYGPNGSNSSLTRHDSPGLFPLSHPPSLPTVNIEYTPLITMKDRAFILRRLRRIITRLRERQRPCLEACLRFLVFKDETFADVNGGTDGLRGLESQPVQEDDEDSDSEEESFPDEGILTGERGQKKDKEATMALLSTHKNLAEPRTCQGSFGPNGELVCFFRAPPRIVRNAVTTIVSQSKSPARSIEQANNAEREQVNINNNENNGTLDEPSSPQAFHQSPALVADAVRRLNLAAADRDPRPRSASSTSALAIESAAISTQDIPGLFEPSYSHPQSHLSSSQPTSHIQLAPVQAQAQITRIMTNLLTFPRHRGRRHSNSFRSSAGLNSIWEIGTPGEESTGREDGFSRLSYRALVAGSSRRSEVVITNTTGLVGGDKSVAADYVFSLPASSGNGGGVDDSAGGSAINNDLMMVCDWNAAVAKLHGRYDHERIFRSIGAVLGTAVTAAMLGVPSEKGFSSGSGSRSFSIVKQLLDRLIADLRAEKDVQMLAMVAVVTLQMFSVPNSQYPPAVTSSNSTSFSTRPGSALDYFSAIHGHRSRTPTHSSFSHSPGHPSKTPNSSAPDSARLPSPATPQITGALLSSRASWSRLFHTGRDFMTAVPPLFQETSDIPASPIRSSPVPASPTWIAVPTTKTPNSSRSGGGKGLRAKWPPDSPIVGRSNRSPLMTPPSAVSRSWNETLPPSSKETTASFSSAGHTQKPTFSQVTSASYANGRKRVVVFEPAPVPQDLQPTFSTEELTPLLRHVYFYSELLARWELYDKRAELLKIVSVAGEESTSAEHKFGLVRTCTNCAMPLPAEKWNSSCQFCENSRTTPQCTVCRLSVKGLSINCMRCFHVTHVTCWKKLSLPICPSGCGCSCGNLSS